MRRPGTPPVLHILAAAGALLGAAAVNAAPLDDATRDELVERLAAPATRPLTRGLGLRSLGPQAPAPRPAADFRCPSTPTLRTLEVEYADDSAAQVDLALAFERGSAELRADSHRLLDTLALALADPRLAGERFVVAGHTDVTGPLALNQRLSCARALAALQYLTQAGGVDPRRVVAYGFGPSRLLPGLAPDSPLHRRVEIRRAPRP